MSRIQSDQLLLIETTCGTLLHELKIIWDEVGESEAERDKMLLELEQECLEVYRRKVDHANRSRALLRRAIADSEAELATMCSALGERPIHIRKDRVPESLKDELGAIIPQVEEMRKRKCDRLNQFVEVLDLIKKISNEIHTFTNHTTSSLVLDETDLSLRKLEELHSELEKLKIEKSNRLVHFSDLLKSLSSMCLVLGIDLQQTVKEVHPSLVNDSEEKKDISDDTIVKLRATIERLREVKLQRMQRLQDLATSMLELWHLMDTPIEEQQIFQNVTCNIAASEHEITEAGMLSEDFINSVDVEVSRLEELKTSKLKELVLRKRSELEEICRKTHLILESDNVVEISIEAIEKGAVDPASVLEEIEVQIGKVKEEAFSRLDILERVEKWLAACEEESWLEEYNMDENRYNTGKGTHLVLKRAEKARALVSKLPGMSEALASKTRSWESERGSEFIYDGIRLLSMLEEYSYLRHEKEQERKRQRDQKRLQGQLIAEKEVLFGSKPNSPMKQQSVKKASKLSSGGGSFKRISIGTTMKTPKADVLQIAKTTSTPTRLAKKNDSASSNVNARELVQSPMKRKLFMPISSSEPSESGDSTNFNEEDPNIFQNELPLKIDFVDNVQDASTIETISSNEEDNMTPKAAENFVQSTPHSLSKPFEADCEEIEKSFEERRAGFLASKHV